MKKEKLIEVINTYLLGLHTQPNYVNAEHARGWKDATNELICSIKDKDGYVNKELGLEDE